jgi:hypothetical protein
MFILRSASILRQSRVVCGNNTLWSVICKFYGGFSIPGIDEVDLSEKFVGGSGPGGQSVNRSKNNVQLVHNPTGIRVNCHEHRSDDFCINKLVNSWHAEIWVPTGNWPEEYSAISWIY